MKIFVCILATVALVSAGGEYGVGGRSGGGFGGVGGGASSAASSGFSGPIPGGLTPGLMVSHVHRKDGAPTHGHSHGGHVGAGGPYPASGQAMSDANQWGPPAMFDYTVNHPSRSEYANRGGAGIGAGAYGAPAGGAAAGGFGGYGRF